jgi:hypothetical protein
MEELFFLKKMNNEKFNSMIFECACKMRMRTNEILNKLAIIYHLLFLLLNLNTLLRASDALMALDSHNNGYGFVFMQV